MNNLRILAKTFLLSITLVSFSCSLNDSEKQTDRVRQVEEINQKNEIIEVKEKPTNQQENVKQTEAEIVLGKDSELTANGLTQNRDMTQYNQGGHFDCRSWIPKNESHGVCDENKIRDFVWQHWTKKKRGYIRITYNSVDATSTFHIFIEPNEKDEWNIIWRIARSHAMPQFDSKITDIWGISVEQVLDKPKKGKWAIIFKNSSGKIIRRMPDYDE